MEITVGMIMELFLEGDNIDLTIFDCEEGQNVWTGPLSRLPDEYKECPIGSIDPPAQADHITLNI